MNREAEVWRALAALIRDNMALVGQRTADYLTQEGVSAYLSLPKDYLSTRIVVIYEALISDLESETLHHLGDLFASYASIRARQGFKIDDMQHAIRLMERVSVEFSRERFSSADDRLVAIERCHAVFAATRDRLFDAYTRAQEAILLEQIDTIKQLSTPIIRIYGGILVLPLIGPVDAQRGARIMDSLLEAVSKERARVVIIDITGVPTMDEGAAACLTRVTQAASLLGARVAVAGIGPEIAQKMVVERVNLGGAVTLGSLEAALQYALARRGLIIRNRRRAVERHPEG